MKKQLLFPVVLLIAALMFSSFSGGKCKFDYEKKDEFTGKAVRYTKYTLYNKYADQATTLELIDYSFQLGDNSGQFNIETGLTIYGETRTSTSESDTSYLKLENGKVVKLIPNSNFPSAPKLYMGGAIVVSDYVPIFNITKSKMQQLAESPIVAIRFSIGGKTYTVKPKESKAAKIMATAACLLSEGGE